MSHLNGDQTVWINTLTRPQVHIRTRSASHDTSSFRMYVNTTNGCSWLMCNPIRENCHRLVRLFDLNKRLVKFGITRDSLFGALCDGGRRSTGECRRRRRILVTSVITRGNKDWCDALDWATSRLLVRVTHYNKRSSSAKEKKGLQRLSLQN